MFRKILCYRCDNLKLFWIQQVFNNNVSFQRKHIRTQYVYMWSKMMHRQSTANSQPPHGKHTTRSTWTQKLILCWNTIFRASKTQWRFVIVGLLGYDIIVNKRMISRMDMWCNNKECLNWYQLIECENVPYHWALFYCCTFVLLWHYLYSSQAWRRHIYC